MSMFRKTALTSAIIGAGLVSTAGAAFAGDAPTEAHHGSHHHHTSTHTTSNTCVNGSDGAVDNGGATQFGGINGSQAALGLNLVCDVLNNSLNGNGSNNTYSVGAPESEPVETATPAASPQQVQQAAPAQSAAPAASPSSVPAGTTTTPIKG
ncbi:hypothetical protein [Actinomycetospora chiangmaiensis]|uniref:hypothetical protein n=1 Tax=Actinomycetospora chiangmaiensis TaxID=402650 RepID=UPI00036654F8|nr:hypothetical protein [Actinomycetospora chiangmaiensis]